MSNLNNNIFSYFSSAIVANTDKQNNTTYTGKLETLASRKFSDKTNKFQSAIFIKQIDSKVNTIAKENGIENILTAFELLLDNFSDYFTISQLKQKANQFFSQSFDDSKDAPAPSFVFDFVENYFRLSCELSNQIKVWESYTQNKAQRQKDRQTSIKLNAEKSIVEANGLLLAQFTKLRKTVFDGLVKMADTNDAIYIKDKKFLGELNLKISNLELEMNLQQTKSLTLPTKEVTKESKTEKPIEEKESKEKEKAKAS